VDVVDVLKKARTLLVSQGVAKGSMYDSVTGSYCALGALDAAAGEDHTAMLAAKRALVNVVHASIPSFNDTSTQDEVIAAFTKAIERAENG
jgi:hypothetical protein